MKSIYSKKIRFEDHKKREHPKYGSKVCCANKEIAGKKRGRKKGAVQEIVPPARVAPKINIREKVILDCVCLGGLYPGPE